MEGGKMEMAPQPDKDAQRGVQGSSTADAWRSADEHSCRYGRRAAQCRAGAALFLRLNDFNSNLTS